MRSSSSKRFFWFCGCAINESRKNGRYCFCKNKGNPYAVRFKKSAEKQCVGMITIIYLNRDISKGEISFTQSFQSAAAGHGDAPDTMNPRLIMRKALLPIWIVSSFKCKPAICNRHQAPKHSRLQMEPKWHLKLRLTEMVRHCQDCGAAYRIYLLYSRNMKLQIVNCDFQRKPFRLTENQINY